MARQKTMATPGGLGSLLGAAAPGQHSMGGATKRLPWWVQLGLIVVAVLCAYFLSAGTGQFLVLTAMGAIIGFACWRDYRLTLIVIVCAVFFVTLAGTRLGPGMHSISGGVNQIGDAGSGAVAGGVSDKLTSVPQVQTVPPTVAVTTVAPPAPVPAVAPAP